MKIKTYVYYVERPDGVLLRGADRSFVVKGEGGYAKIARLIDHCDGRFTRDQLRAAVPASGRGWFDALVAEMEVNRFLLPSEPVAEGVDDVGMNDGAGADVRAYLSDWHDSPGAAFAHWRAARLTLVGSGRLAGTAAQALADFGFGGWARDGAVALVLADDLRGFDLSAMLAEAGVAPERPLLIAGLCGDSALVLPVLPDAAGAMALLDRLRLPDHGALASQTMLTVAGGLIALAALNHVVGGLPASIAPSASLTHVTAHGLVSAHPVPDAYWGGEGRRAPMAWGVGEDGLHDPLVGLFLVDHADADSQLPMHLFGLRIRSPHGADLPVVGWGTTEQEAAYRAHSLTVAAYAGGCVAVCRDGGRVAFAATLGNEGAGGAMKSADAVAPVGGRAAMFARMLRIYGADVQAALTPVQGWWRADVTLGGQAYHCVAEDGDAALGEILGTLAAGFQAGWDGQGRLAHMAALAIRVPDSDDGAMEVKACVDPLLARLGWHVAVCA